MSPSAGVRLQSRATNQAHKTDYRRFVRLDVADKATVSLVRARFWHVYSEVAARTGSNPAWVHASRLLINISEFPGWGTWIRTKAARSRAGSSTAKLSPKRGAGARQYHAPNTPATSTDGCQLGSQRVG